MMIILSLKILQKNFSLLYPIFSDMRIFVFGLAFVLHVLRLSRLNGFWKNLWNTDATTHKMTISYQIVLRKYMKAKFDIIFLRKREFFWWKNNKNKHLKEKKRPYHASLVIALKDRNNYFTSLAKKHEKMKIQLRHQQLGWNITKLFIFWIIYKTPKHL